MFWLNIVILGSVISIRVWVFSVSPQLVCACVCALIPSPPAKGLEPKSDPLKLKRLAGRVMCSPAGELGTLDSFSMWRGCQLPSLTLQCSQHLGNIKFWSSCLWYFLLCSWHHWTHWLFNSYLNTCFYWIFAFSPYGGLASDTPE